MTAPLTPLEELTPLREAQLPGWRRWVFPAALIWAFGYGAFRVFSALTADADPPSARTDLVALPGWWSVALCGAAALVLLGLRYAPWSRLFAAIGWLVAAGLVFGSALILLDVVGILLPGAGVATDLAGFASRAACLAGGLLVGAHTVSYQRNWRGACPACGSAAASLGPAGDDPPRWAQVAAGLAVCGWLVRVVAQAAVGLDGELLRGSPAGVCQINGV